MKRYKNIDQVVQAMRDSSKIRNISIIAHVDHGKTTLTDSLVSRAGLISKREAGDKNFTYSREDEKEKGITIKSTAVSLPMDWKGELYIVNLIDCPGHADFSGEVTSALRLTDGAVVVVDCVEGVSAQTEVVLRQAFAEQVKPVLFVNKIDRMFFELSADLEEIYQMLCRTIESVNMHIAMFQDSDDKDCVEVDPLRGNVAFGSGLYGWAFTIDTFAELYAKASGISKKKWVKRLWGENFYDHKSKKWVTVRTSDPASCPRGFCEYILKPISKVLSNLREENVEEALSKLKSVGMESDESFEKDLAGLSSKKDIVRSVMSRWIPASEALLSMVIDHLPSPHTSQKYKIAVCYAGPVDDQFALEMRECNSEGTLMGYVSKMIPNDDASRFIGVTRIFSGTLKRNHKLRVISGNLPEVEATAQRAHLLVGNQMITIDEAPAGMIVGISGLEKSLVRSGTITSSSEAFPFKQMSFTVSSVVRMAVSCENPKDTRKLVEGLRRLEKVDSTVQVFIDERTDQCIIAGVGELHLEICCNDLKQYLSGVPIKLSQPVVPFMETINSSSDFMCLAKTANKLNHLMARVNKLDEEVTRDLEEEKGIHRLREQVNLKNIWATSGPNILLDSTKGVQNLSQIKASVIKSFEEFHGGVLCEEPVRGMLVELVDCKIHSDSSHRGFNQIAPASRALFQACQMAGEPRLMEPVYEVEIRVSRKHLQGAFVVLAKRKAAVLRTSECGSNGALMNVVAHLKVRQSFGFTGSLSGETSGQAFAQMCFSHWELVEGDPFDKGSEANKLVMETRQRKGLSMTLPSLEDFHSKI